MPGASFTPEPTVEDVAAIVAAVEALWPKPVVLAPEHMHRVAAWRFSGRWWSKPIPVGRDRPWY